MCYYEEKGLALCGPAYVLCSKKECPGYKARGCTQSSDPYEKCPILETDHFILRLVTMEDAEDLLQCYSDPKSQELFDTSACTSDFRYQTVEEMRE